jgi:hypothetical protein
MTASNFSGAVFFLKKGKGVEMKRYLLIIFIVFGLSLIGAQVVFCQLERGKAAPQEVLPDELRHVEVKDYYIGSDAGAVGRIQAVAGHVVVARFEESEAYFAAPGDEVFTGDVLYTLKSSRCRVLFFGQDLITLGDNTRIVIEEVIDDRETGEKKSAFSMLRGKVMCYVMRLFRYKHISFSISTPTAVTGVRGTKFGVEVKTKEPVEDMTYWEANTVGGTETTTVHCFEGKVEVYSPVDGTAQGVEGGESLELSVLGAGIVEPTTPEAAERFILDTEALPMMGEEAQSGDGEAVAGVETGNDIGASGSGLQDYVTDVVQRQVTNVTENADRRPTEHYGYFAGMLTNAATGVDGAYRSQNICNFDSNMILASNGMYYMCADGSADYNDPEITYLQTPDGGYVISGLPASVRHTELGHNACMEWGHWTQPLVMSDGTDAVYFDNRGYYVLGDYTTDSQMSVLAANNIAGTYSGGAYGTYWTSTGGADMSGDFSTRVNFAAGSLSDFKVSVLGGGHSASVNGASGMFTGPSSQFEIDGATGAWQIDGSPGTGEAAGSVYGPNGDAIGGSWEIGDGTGHAVGMFEGTR